jgi:CBS domain-containing protein
MWASEGVGSVLSASVWSPRSANANAVAAAHVVFPTPPLPTNTWTRVSVAGAGTLSCLSPGPVIGTSSAHLQRGRHGLRPERALLQEVSMGKKRSYEWQVVPGATDYKTLPADSTDADRDDIKFSRAMEGKFKTKQLTPPDVLDPRAGRARVRELLRQAHLQQQRVRSPHNPPRKAKRPALSTPRSRCGRGARWAVLTQGGMLLAGHGVLTRRLSLGAHSQKRAAVHVAQPTAPRETARAKHHTTSCFALPFFLEVSMKARDLMTPMPTVVTADEPLSRVAEIMDHIDIGMVPVVDGYTTMRPVGVITDRDIALRHVAHGHGPECTVGDHMSEGILDTVRDDDQAHDVVGRMKHFQIRRILVVDKQHRLVGVISVADIALKMGHDAPKLVAELVEFVSSPCGALVVV